MIELTIMLMLALAVAVILAYLLGFRMAHDQSDSVLARIRFDSAEASRRMHDVTRNAFVAMAEQAQRRAPNTK